MLIAFDKHNGLILGVKIGKTLIVLETMGFSINLLKLSFKVAPTTIGIASTKLGAQWVAVGYARSNEVGFGLFKVTWSV